MSNDVNFVMNSSQGGGGGWGRGTSFRVEPSHIGPHREYPLGLSIVS